MPSMVYTSASDTWEEVLPQQFKSVYFSDALDSGLNKRSLSLAFGPEHQDLYSTVRSLTSEELRGLLGHSSYAAVANAATGLDMPLNAYCMAILEENAPYFVQPQLAFSPIQTTFRGGDDEPLHGWFPYLEAYSPEFVQAALERYGAEPQRILDPFAGLGTTPITAASLGITSFYSELNPVLRNVIAAKVQALSLPPGRRVTLSGSLGELSADLERKIEAVRPDEALRSAFRVLFAGKRVFSDTSLDIVLRLRTLIDATRLRERVLGDLLEIAVLGALVSASEMVRRGDLRYRTAREQRSPRAGMVEQVCERLSMIAGDVQAVEPIEHRPLLVANDARGYGLIPSLGVDAIMTSPPYLNGTNYFRNTKIELWFTRSIKSTDDLSSFRRMAVTAGINDVYRDVGAVGLPDSVRSTVRNLERSAYDSRIPRMAAQYFSDMRDVFAGLLPHLRSGGQVLIDIGDSEYAGVEVATDTLLLDVLEPLGYAPIDTVNLRSRRSKSGSELRQVLLVLKRKPRRPARKTQSDPKWRAAWDAMKTDLPHQSPPFNKRNWGHPLHSLCSYQGKMKPSLAHHLVATFCSPGSRLLDPFGGVGTIPFEAALQGVRAWSFDISPLGVQVSQAKMGMTDEREVLAAIQVLESALAREVTEAEVNAAASLRFNRSLVEYFNERTLREIIAARSHYKDHPPSTVAESLVFSSLLHILHGNRPYALSRRSHPITPFAPSGDWEYRALIPRLRAKALRSLAEPLPTAFVAGQVLNQDATADWPREVCDLDAIITSPPFFDSTRFYLANWMRLWFCGWESTDFATQPTRFIDERQKLGFDSYQSIFRQARERLKPGAPFVLHLGNSKKCDMATELRRVAAPWFEAADLYREDVGHCESHGISDKGAVVEHVYLVLS